MKKLLLAAAACAAFAAPASAEVVVLDFIGVANPSNSTTVGDFYNGGTSGDGNSGTNYGVAFTANALAINVYNGTNEPDPGILFFLDGANVNITYAAGFTTGFSFFYASNSEASITVYDGENGTGNVLATLDLAVNFQPGCGYCQWDPIGVAFAGVAKSIDFAGGANFVAYDRITFGSDRPGGAIPEPATWALMILGFGLVGASARRRSRTVHA
jgi:hypothetical protein